MVHLTRHAHELLARQHGVASTQQLLDSGLSAATAPPPPAVRQDLELVLRGAYRTPSAPDTELARALRCARLAPTSPSPARQPGGSGDSAGSRPTIGSTCSRHRRATRRSPDGWCRTEPMRATITTSLERDDGIRITSRARTAFDLARWLGPDDLLSVIEQAAHDGRLDDGDFLDVAADWLSPRRPWARAFLQALDRRLPGGRRRVASRGPRRRRSGPGRSARARAPASNRTPRSRRASGSTSPIPELRWAIEVDLHPRHRETMGIASDTRRDRAAGTHRLDAPAASSEIQYERPVQRNDRRTRRHSCRPPTRRLAGSMSEPHRR